MRAKDLQDTAGGGLATRSNALETADTRALRAEIEALTGELDSLNRKIDQAVLDTDARAKSLLRDTSRALGRAPLEEAELTRLETAIWQKLETRIDRHLAESDSQHRRELKALRAEVMEMGEVVQALAERGGLEEERYPDSGGVAVLIGAVGTFATFVMIGFYMGARYLGWL